MTPFFKPKFVTLALASALLVVGCSGVELLNRQPAQEVARSAQPAGSAYIGWRVFQQRCASCHGSAGNGTAKAPNLLPLVRDMGARRFVGLVLNRYDWGLPSAQAKVEGPAKEALVDTIVQRSDAPLSMPAWQGEPVVTAHIADLYAYLSARSQGTLGTGRPLP